MAGQIKIIYREIYVELMGELEEISHFKFIGLKNQVPIYVDNYFEVLFRNSYHVIRVIHLNHFPKCIEICLKPVTEAILAIKSRSKKE